MRTKTGTRGTRGPLPWSMLTAVVVAGSTAVGLTSWQEGTARAADDPGRTPAAAGSASDSAARIERGKYMVTAGGCNDCHTPMKMGPAGPERDWDRLLSGHPQDLQMPAAPSLPPGPWVATVSATMTAWSGPWGTTFCANLTPDDETGTGRWTEEEFIATLRSGRHLGRGRPILPPMPWDNYALLSDEDLGAIYGYLQSIPPIRNKVPEPVPPAGGN